MTTITPQTRVNSGSAFDAFSGGLASRVMQAFDIQKMAASLWDVAHYVAGADRYIGQGNNLFTDAGLHYTSWHDPFDRAAYMGNGLLAGLGNLATLGGLYNINECFREISSTVHAGPAIQLFSSFRRFMRPPSRNYYEMGEWVVDGLTALVSMKVMFEYRTWAAPINQRRALMTELSESQRLIVVARQQAILEWAKSLGNGDLAAALPKLREMATRLPGLADKDIPAQLEMGNHAMEALGMVSRQYPQATEWMKDAVDLAPVANCLTETHAGIVSSAQSRLMIAVRYAPESVVDAVTESMMNRFRDPFEPGDFQVIDYAATPQFTLLKLWESDAALQPHILRAYQIVSMNSESFAVATRAAEGIVRMLPGSQDAAVELLNDSNALTRYAMMRALMRQHILTPNAIPAVLVTRLQQFPMSECLVLIGKEAKASDAYTLIFRAVALGNESALRLAESMVESSHTYGTIGVLRQIRAQLPQYAERITTFLKTVDPSVTENDVIFNVTADDPYMASENARLLVELAKEGNLKAKDAVSRLSLNEHPKIMEEAAARLVDLADAGILKADEVHALMQDPGPRLLDLVMCATLKQSAAVQIQWDSFSQAVLAANEFPQGVLQVLRYYARLGDKHVGHAVSQYLRVAGTSQRDLLAILRDFPEARQTVDWNHLAAVMNASLNDIGLQLYVVKLMDDVGGLAALPLKTYSPAWFEGAANAGDVQGLAGLETLAIQENPEAIMALRRMAAKRVLRDHPYNMAFAANRALANLSPEARAMGNVKPQPTVQLEVTAFDVQQGVASTLAREIMAGTRTLKSMRELTMLKTGVEAGAQGALDAIYKIAWQEGAFSAEAKEILKRWDATSESPHQATVQIMVRVLDQKGAPMIEASSVPEHVMTLRSIRHLESLITVSSEYDGMAMDALIRQLRRNPDEMLAVAKRLLASPDRRVLDVVVERLLRAARNGHVRIDVLRAILEEESSSLGKVTLQNKLAYELLTTTESNPLEQLHSWVP